MNEAEALKIYKRALKNIVGLCNSYGDNPMPQSTAICGEEALDALNKVEALEKARYCPYCKDHFQLPSAHPFECPNKTTNPNA